METPLTSAWDERLRAAVRGEGPIATTGAVAAHVRALVEAPSTPGRGEDHPVP